MMDGLLTMEALAARWGVHKRHARRIAPRLRLRAVDFGYRTKRFRAADVLRAEAQGAGERSGR